MRRSTFKCVEGILRDYPKIPSYIKQREQELMYPVQTPDENIGGGRASTITKPQEQMIITLDEDRRLNALKRQRNLVDDTLDEFGNDTEVIINELYFKKRQEYTIEGLIEQRKIFVGRSKAFELKTKFIENLGAKLGLY
ncbi:transcriptional regulator [Latilactobacillus sakei]|uniref:transcriptional regulator n=1 Tax=Latilactobacillus sakei TaxID=1599 RepID=UPI000EAA7D81|nr:transcriptional regulator [Latilactobacillus sakei]AYG16516.1 transcriptional regulator [Latilactobacillus sakei]AYG25237.1 transcriptional regulator [Latilactobacillus sakei]AYG30385.1 transcriptional regulator [Latilactobacillus sakei]AYG32156.1 transcriptional regulator [Latilactobacillus sakei]